MDCLCVCVLKEARRMAHTKETEANRITEAETKIPAPKYLFIYLSRPLVSIYRRWIYRPTWSTLKRKAKLFINRAELVKWRCRQTACSLLAIYNLYRLQHSTRITDPYLISTSHLLLSTLFKLLLLLTISRRDKRLFVPCIPLVVCIRDTNGLLLAAGHGGLCATFVHRRGGLIFQFSKGNQIKRAHLSTTAKKKSEKRATRENGEYVEAVFIITRAIKDKEAKERGLTRQPAHLYISGVAKRRNAPLKRTV